MTTVKEICLGVAVAGVVAGAGSAMATAVAYAEPAVSDSPSSTDAGPAKSSGADDAPSRKSSRSADKPDRESNSPRDVTAPRTKTSSSNTEADETQDSPVRRSSSRTAVSKAVEPAAETTTETTEVAADESGPTETAATTQAVVQTTATPDMPPPAAPAVTTTAAPAVEADLLEVAPVQPAPTPVIPVPAPLVPATPASATSVSASSKSASRSRATTSGDVAAQLVDPANQHVLVIGVDGTNLGRVLANDLGNANFLALMNSGTTGASTIVGHTTISNPSWTTILTGVWDNKSGVINNVFTPHTYNTWPTVFNQLEAAYGDGINTKAIADWQVIADIAGAGSIPADKIVFVPQGADDPLYVAADAEVTAETVRSILGTTPGYEDVPNFLFTYVTQVDEAGHVYGGASPQYQQAITRTNTNIGLILDAVAAREAATCAAGASTCEDWTIIMVTDHGHQPQQGFGHGFQSPAETSTFVIIDSPGIPAGQQNLNYSISDITPTVVSLFGLTPTADADGVPLSQHGDTQVAPVDLEAALQAAIDSYGWPDIQTNVALTVRTIFATIPYYVDTFVTDITAQLQSIADQGDFLISDLAAVAIIPVKLIGGAVYAVTDLIAQLVARLTGAGVIPPSTSTTELQRDGQAYPWVSASDFAALRF